MAIPALEDKWDKELETSERGEFNSVTNCTLREVSKHGGKSSKKDRDALLKIVPFLREHGMFPLCSGIIDSDSQEEIATQHPSFNKKLRKMMRLVLKMRKACDKIEGEMVERYDPDFGKALREPAACEEVAANV